MLKKMVHSYFLYFCIMVQNLTEAEMSLLAKAERYCANEEQCRTSVRKKLCDWGATPDSSNKIVTRLIDQGFIDERRYARAYVSAKLRTQKWGRLKVVYQLRSKQVPPKFITEALAEIPDEEYRNIMLDVANMKWGSYDTRLPTDVKVEGRNDDGEWQFIVRSKDGKLSYEEQTWADSSHPDKVGLYYYSDKKADFVNWLSYRQYRITVYDTGTPSDNNPLQISEILLLGTCGITIEPPSMQTGDITKAVREIGLETAVSCTTHTPAEGSGFVGFDAMTDGLLSRYGEAGSQRLFIANGEQARTTPMVMTIDVPEAFYPVLLPSM